MARSRRGRSGGLTALAIGLIALAGLAAAGLTAVYFTANRPPVLDRESLCPVTGPEAVTVVLVDPSDDLPEPTKREVAQHLTDLAHGLAPRELLELRVLDPDATLSRPVFSRCNPGDGEGLSEWTANPKLARRRWQESFDKPATAAVEASLGKAAADRSPIMAAIQDIALDRFTGERAATIPLRLIVISDMVEHDVDYSQYGGDLSFERYQRSVAYRKYSTNLNGADVTLFVVQRLKPRIDSTALVMFWRQWIIDNNGRFGDALRLQGAE